MLFQGLLAGIESGSVPTAEFWVAHGADLRGKPLSFEGFPVAYDDKVDILRRAIRSGNPAMVRWALNKGIDPNKRPPGKEATLTYALYNVADLRAELIQVLLEAGADPNARTYGGTALSQTSDPKILQLLRKAGAHK